MSQPELPPLPPIPEPPKEGQVFSGKALISIEELETAVKKNTYVAQIDDYIAQDQAYIKKLQADIAEALRPVYRIRRLIARMRERIYNRQRQRKQVVKDLRRTMAYKRIKEIRKEIGIN